MLISLYVDDLIICGIEMKEIINIKNLLNKNYNMKDLGPLTYYLGIQIVYDESNRLMKLHQYGYIQDL